MIADRRTELLHTFELMKLRPMLAQSRTTPFDSPQHLFELKWDGIRYLAYRLERDVTLLNRKGADGTRRYPELLDPLMNLPPLTVIDGEIVSLENGVPSLSKLMRRDQVKSAERIRSLSLRAPVLYVAFDVLVMGGDSVMELPLLQRKQMLHGLVEKMAGPRLIESQHVLHRGNALFEEAVARGYEGVIAKRLTSTYHPGRRTDDWLKIKPFQTREFDVIGFTTEDHEPRISALILGERVDGRMMLRGKVGSGFTESDRRAIYAQISPMPAWPDPPPGGPRNAQWRKTGLKSSVRFFELTNDGKLRVPSFKGFV